MGPELPFPNNHGTAEVVNGIIYLIGGATGSSSDPGGVGYQNAVWAMDPDIGIWEQRSPMPTRRRGLNSAVIDGQIYVAGGQPPQAFDFAVFDPQTDSWETLPNLPYGPNHFILAAIGDKIHAMGGRLQSNHTSELTDKHAIYDPATRSWAMGTPLPRASSGNNGVLAFACFHVWGGEGGGVNHDEMMADHIVYDPRSKTWTRPARHATTGAWCYRGLHLKTVLFMPLAAALRQVVDRGAHINQAYQPTIRCDE